MKLERHSWGEKTKNDYAEEQQQCTKCGLWKQKSMGIVTYRSDKATNKNPYTANVGNIFGCNKVFVTRRNEVEREEMNKVLIENNLKKYIR